MHNFFVLKCPHFFIYCLQEKSTHFSLRVLTNFGLEVLGCFGLRKLDKRYFNCIRSSRIIFCPKMF